MHINQMSVLLFYPLFIKVTSKVFQSSLDPDNINININIKGYHNLHPVIKTNIHGEDITKEDENFPEEFQKEMKSGLTDENWPDESCTERSDCYKNGKMCDGVRDTMCVCKNKRCKKSSRCGKARWAWRYIYIPCNTCNGNAEGCDDEGACIFNFKDRKCVPIRKGICLDPFGIHGPCKGSNIRWSYKQKERRCKKFIYGGCGGNENNFFSRKKCKQACKTGSDVLGFNPCRGNVGISIPSPVDGCNSCFCTKDEKISFCTKVGCDLPKMDDGRNCKGRKLTCDTKSGQCFKGKSCIKLSGACCSIDPAGQRGTWRPSPPHFLYNCGYCWTDIVIGPDFCVKHEDCGVGRWGRCYRNKCRNWVVGRPFIVQGKSRTTSSQTCSSSNLKKAESWEMGEAPLVQSSNPYNQEIGHHWLKQAEAEHASVASFARHTLQLMSIGAPSRLLVASQRASLDEIKHAKMCYGFASAFIGSDLGPGSLDVNGSLESVDLKDIIESLIIEGCIGETLSAIEAHLAAHNAQDTYVKAAMSEIASDETKHAQLAWDTIKWIIEKYPDSQTFAEDIFDLELEQRRTPAINDSALIPATLCEHSEKDASYRRYGLLVSGDRDKVSGVGIRDIIEPVYRSGFKGVNMISKRITKLDMATLAHEDGFQDIIEAEYRAKFTDVDMISKQITELDAVTL